jgi:hypothetical protein
MIRIFEGALFMNPHNSALRFHIESHPTQSVRNKVFGCKKATNFSDLTCIIHVIMKKKIVLTVLALFLQHL